MSIIDALEKISKKRLLSFHVPGHKNGRLLSSLPVTDKLGYYDTTEIQGTDNLHAPESAIKRSQESAASFYGALESFYLVNGTTGGNIAMMYGAFKPGDEVLVCRDAHKSIFTGIIVSQIKPVYIAPQIDKKLGMSLSITANQVEEAFKKNSNIKGLVLTYPSYHGICAEIETIANIVHAAGAILLVDAAHGAHLTLSHDLPIGAIKARADIVVHSIHKSLPAFTQSSILHYCSSRVSLDRLKMALSMFQSSSPSYLLMASLENAILVAREKGYEYMEELLLNINFFQKKIEQQTIFRVLKSDMVSKIYGLDPTKITILTQNTGISGGDLDKCLRKKFGIQCEYATDSMVLFMTSIATSRVDLNYLLNALVDISQEIQNSIKIQSPMEALYDFENFELKALVLPSEAIYMDKIKINLLDSIGCIAGEFIVPYPPGVPIVIPGEVISKQVVNFIEEGIRKGYNINGVYGKNKFQVNIIRR